MGRGFTLRQAATAALTANAVRPVPGDRSGIPAFFAGWLTGELAPHLLALTAADAATHAFGRRRSPTGLALAGASMAGLGYLVAQGRQAQHEVETALVEGLGDADLLDAPSGAADLATPWPTIVNPFAFARAATRQGVHVQRDVEFAPYGRRGRLDVYTSDKTPASGAPVLLQVHGGAWVLGAKEQQGLPLMQFLAAKGWVCVAINYRLAPRDPWPAQIIDVKRAIAWIKEHIADYGGDPSYLAITGGSAGGHLSSLAALTPNDPAWQPGFEDADTTVQVAVPHYGVYDFAGETGLRSVTGMRDGFLAPRVLQRRYADAPDVYEAASPILRITPDAPDFFVVHGVHDTLVRVGQARAFVERLREVSKQSVVYVELAGAQHAFDIFPSIRSAHLVRGVDRYLTWHHNGWRRDHEPAESA